MTAKTVAIGAALVLVLAGCPLMPRGQSNVISGNTDTVSIKSGRYSNPGPKATEHCAKYGKGAVLENVTEMTGFSIYTFKCQ